MAQVEIIYGIQSITEDQLINAKATKIVEPVTSKSGIKYNIPTYLWIDKKNKFIMVILQNDDGSYRRRWILVPQAEQILKTAGSQVLTRFPPDVTDRFIILPTYCFSILNEIDKTRVTQAEALANIRPTIQKNLETRLQKVIFLLTKIQEGKGTPQEIAVLPQLQQLKLETEKQIASTNECTDLLSEFIIVEEVRPAIPITPTPPVTTIIRPLAGFREVPTAPAIGPRRVRVPVPLSPSIQQDIDKFMRLESCTKAGKVFRVDSIISRLQDHLSNPEKNRFKFLNLSTCHFGEPNKNDHDTFIGTTLPGSNIVIQLSINKIDSARLIRPGVPGRLTEEDEPLIHAMFSRIQDIVLERFGTATIKPEPSPIKITTSLIERIPVGIIPATKPRAKVVPAFTFIETIPFTGVANVTIPITDNKRCLPSLSVKKG